jgi:hypothetical protein
MQTKNAASIRDEGVRLSCIAFVLLNEPNEWVLVYLMLVAGLLVQRHTASYLQCVVELGSVGNEESEGVRDCT